VVVGSVPVAAGVTGWPHPHRRRCPWVPVVSPRVCWSRRTPP